MVVDVIMIKKGTVKQQTEF